MAKQNINVGTAANDKKGDSLRTAFQKVNANFTELYTKLGLVNDVTLNLGAFEFTGSTMTTVDSTAIVIDQSVTVSSDLSVGGDLLPQTANGGDLGSSSLPWRSLYVSNNTIYIGGATLGIDANGNLTVNGSRINAPGSTLVNGTKTVSLGSDGLLNVAGPVTLPNYGEFRPSSAAYDAALAGWESFRSGEAASAVALNITEAMRPFIGWRVNGGNVAAYLAELERVWAIQQTGGATPVWTPVITSTLRAQMRAAMLAVQNAYTSVGSDVSIASGQGKYWNFSGDGALTIPGDIKSEGNINIDINLSDSTLRRWQFGEDGELTFPDGYLKIVPNGANPYISNRTDNGLGLVSGSAIQIRQSVADAYGITIDSSTTDTSLGGGALLASGSTIDVNGGKIILGQYTVNNLDATTGLRVQNKIEINNSAILIGRYVSTLTSGTTISAFSGWTFGTDGTTQLPDSSIIRTQNWGAFSLKSDNADIVIMTDVDNSRGWTFRADGNLTFPDATVQTTAWTGSIGTLSTLSVTGAVTAETFNTDQITVVGNRISTTVTNANLELECNGTGGVIINTVADATTASTVKSVGYLGLPQSATATTATLTIGDAGKHIYITSTGQTITIPAASSVAYPIGTTITFIAGSSATTTTIAINTDTLRLAGGTSTGSRTLAANGMATAVKVSGTSSAGVWYINGIGLT